MIYITKKKYKEMATDILNNDNTKIISIYEEIDGNLEYTNQFNKEIDAHIFKNFPNLEYNDIKIVTIELKDAIDEVLLNNKVLYNEIIKAVMA